MKNYENLDVWRKAHELVLRIYEQTGRFPREEIYGLTSQIRRAASSVPSNIAEGCGRTGDADFARFLQIAMGSASELRYQLLLARDLEFLASEVHERLTNDLDVIMKMLATLLKRLRANRQ